MLQAYTRTRSIAYICASRIYWHICICATRDHEHPSLAVRRYAPSIASGCRPGSRLEGLRPSPCGIPPLRPVGLWQGFGTRKPPSRYTKSPASRASRNVRQVCSRAKVRKREFENGRARVPTRRISGQLECQRNSAHALPVARDATRRTWRDEVSGHGAARRIKVAQQPASTPPEFVVARSAKHVGQDVYPAQGCAAARVAGHVTPRRGRGGQWA